MENKALVVLGIDCELVLRRVEDVKQKVTLSGAVQDTRTQSSTTFQYIEQRWCKILRCTFNVQSCPVQKTIFSTYFKKYVQQNKLVQQRNS